MTFLFFPILVIIVYAADHNFFLGGGQVAPEEEGGADVEQAAASNGDAGGGAMSKFRSKNSVSLVKSCTVSAFVCCVCVCAAVPLRDNNSGCLVLRLSPSRE